MKRDTTRQSRSQSVTKPVKKRKGKEKSENTATTQHKKKKKPQLAKKKTPSPHNLEKSGDSSDKCYGSVRNTPASVSSQRRCSASRSVSACFERPSARTSA